MTPYDGRLGKRRDSTTMRAMRAVGCEEFEASIESIGSLGDLSERLFAHADVCENCATHLARRQAFAVLTQRTQRALEQARPAPPNLDHAALRAAVEDAQKERWWRAFGLVGVGLATAVGLAILTTPVVQIGQEGAPEVAVRALAPAGQRLAEVGPRESGEPVVAHEEALPRVGQRVDAGVDGVSFEAFGRHRVELAPGAVMEVARLDELGVELELLVGLGTFSVKRASEAEVFRVKMEGVVVSVRGTVFSVERVAEGVRVSVEHGRVAVDREGAQTVFVSEGASSLFDVSESVAKTDVSKVETSNVLKVETSAQPRSRVLTVEKVVQIDVDAARMKVEGEKFDVSNLLGPLMQAVRAQRCVQALAALRALGAKVELPRSAVWMQAYCKRRLGDVEGSKLLFSRYGPSGPWSIPSGDELPPLPD